MANTHLSASGPTPAANIAASANEQPNPTPAQLEAALDNTIWYLLSLWHPLHVAVASLWGGPQSADKRDWMAGAVSELLTSRPETDVDELGQFLVDIMMDEFDCNVEDDSEVPVAEGILRVRGRMSEERTLDAAREVEERWRRRGTMKTDVNVQIVEHEVGQDEYASLREDEDEDDDDDDDDDEMEDAPQLVSAAPAKEKPAPEVDEDGFTKVVGKKTR